jgi:hypothetical protein
MCRCVCTQIDGKPVLSPDESDAATACPRVQDALRLIDADLHQVRRSIQQHGGGRQSSGRKQQAEPEEDSFAELQRKWS